MNALRGPELEEERPAGLHISGPQCVCKSWEHTHTHFMFPTFPTVVPPPRRPKPHPFLGTLGSGGEREGAGGGNRSACGPWVGLVHGLWRPCNPHLWMDGHAMGSSTRMGSRMRGNGGIGGAAVMGS